MKEDANKINNPFCALHFASIRTLNNREMIAKFNALLHDVLTVVDRSCLLKLRNEHQIKRN